MLKKLILTIVIVSLPTAIWQAHQVSSENDGLRARVATLEAELSTAQTREHELKSRLSTERFFDQADLQNAQSAFNSAKIAFENAQDRLRIAQNRGAPALTPDPGARRLVDGVGELNREVKLSKSEIDQASFQQHQIQEAMSRDRHASLAEIDLKIKEQTQKKRALDDEARALRARIRIDPAAIFRMKEAEQESAIQAQTIVKLRTQRAEDDRAWSEKIAQSKSSYAQWVHRSNQSAAILTDRKLEVERALATARQDAATKKGIRDAYDTEIRQLSSEVSRQEVIMKKASARLDELLRRNSFNP